MYKSSGCCSVRGCCFCALYCAFKEKKYFKRGDFYIHFSLMDGNWKKISVLKF